jgi:hypothetical protein
VLLKTIRKVNEKCTLRNTYETNLNKRRIVKTMAPYTPPVTHYSQMDVSMYDEEQLFAFIGRTGKRFYWLTQKLGLENLWYDKKRKVIEIWGPFYTHQNEQSAHVIRCELEFFMAPKLEGNLQEQYVQTTLATC